MKKRSPKRVGDILARMKSTTDLGRQLDRAVIWERWPELAGPHLSTHGHPVAVKENRLCISVDSPVWMHKFAYRKWDIVRRINRLVGYELISDVFVQLGDAVEGENPQPGV